MWRVDGATSFECGSNGIMRELARCIVFADVVIVDSHSHAMGVHESGNPHGKHEFVGASLYLYSSFPLHSWPYRNLNMFMPSFGDLQM